MLFQNNEILEHYVYIYNIELFVLKSRLFVTLGQF